MLRLPAGDASSSSGGEPPVPYDFCVCVPISRLLTHPLTSSRHHPPAAAATTTLWLSFGFQRPHRPNFKLFWSAAVAAAGLDCLSRRVCAVKPNNVVNVFGRCRPVKTRRRLRVHSVINVKALVGAFNQEKALVWAFSVITNLPADLRFKL